MLDVRHRSIRVAQVVVLRVVYGPHGRARVANLRLVKILSDVLIAFASRELQFQMLPFFRGWSSCTAFSSSITSNMF